MQSLTTHRSRNSVAARRTPRLPFEVALGPYRVAVEFVEREDLMDRRRRACINIELGRIELRSDLRGMQLLEAFFDCLVRLSHFSKGCQQGCVEEAYTHSFATGLVEFAQRNPPRMPRRILVRGTPIMIRSIPKSETGSAFGWYHFSRQEAQLYRGLTGANLAIVALHEITHAVHHVYAIKQRDRHANFRRAQVQGWLDIVKRNPGAWRWLAWVISFPQDARLMPTLRREA